MNKNNLTNIKQDLDLYEIAFIAWKTKWITISFIVVALILGCIVFFLTPSMTVKQTENIATVNVLIADVPILNKTKLTATQIADDINFRFASAYNYETWAEKNLQFSSLLPQSFATAVRMMQERHIVNFNYRNDEHLKALLSFVNHTMLNHSKILEGGIKSSQKEEIKVLREKIERRKDEQDQNYKYRLLEIDNEITNRSIELVGAKEELAFIESEIAQKPEFAESGVLMIRLLDLSNKVKVESLIVENLKMRRDSYREISEQMDNQLQSMNSKLVRLEEDLLDSNELVRIGRVATDVIAPYQPKFLLVMLVCAVAGLILSIIFIMIKTEFDQRKLIKKS
tara:strand:- start:809 stop:1828 length:1020 start_codon:yes stop_codon:yes gene_type:complete